MASPNPRPRLASPRWWVEDVSAEAVGLRRELPVGTALTLAFLALYTVSVDLDAPSLFRFNFLLDTDILRVSTMFTGQTAVDSMRHPLYMLLFGDLGTLLAALGIDGRYGARFASSLAGALAVGFGYVVVLRIVRRRLEAVLLATLFGVTSSVWLLSSIPETFAINALAIVLAFLFQDGRFASPRQSPGRFAGYVGYTVVALGVTLPNFVYAALGYLNNLRRPPGRSAAGKLVSLAVYLLASFLLFSALNVIQTSRYPDSFDHLGGSPTRVIAEDHWFLTLARPITFGDIGDEARDFLADNLVARPIEVRTIATTKGPQQLIQFTGSTSPWHAPAFASWVVLACLLLWAVATAARRLIASPTLQLALACLAFNAVLHYFYRGHGQRFIFAIHVVFPLTVVLAELLAASRVGWRRPLTAVLALSVVLTAGANGTFVGRANELLAVRCVAEGGQGLPICVRWEDGRDGSLVPEP